MKCILLHGLGQTPSDWNDTVKNLDENFEVSCPALFEWLHGTEFCYANLYQRFEKYCNQFEEPFVLGGLSLGGILALQYGIEHSNKVESLILIGTQFSMPKNLLRFQNMVFRFLVQAVLGGILIYGMNQFFLSQNIVSIIALNPLTILTCGFLGIPGVLLLLGVQILSMI